MIGVIHSGVSLASPGSNEFGSECERVRRAGGSPTSPGAGWTRIVGPWVAAVILVVGGLGAALLSVPLGAHQVAAVFPPWWPPARIFAAASMAGEVAGTGALRSVLVVRSDRAALASRLQAAGALLVLAADAPFGCRPPPSQDTER